MDILPQNVRQLVQSLAWAMREPVLFSSGGYLSTGLSTSRSLDGPRGVFMRLGFTKIVRNYNSRSFQPVIMLHFVGVPAIALSLCARFALCLGFCPPCHVTEVLKGGFAEGKRATQAEQGGGAVWVCLRVLWPKSVSEPGRLRPCIGLPCCGELRCGPRLWNAEYVSKKVKTDRPTGSMLHPIVIGTAALVKARARCRVARFSSSLAAHGAFVCL